MARRTLSRHVAAIVGGTLLLAALVGWLPTLAAEREQVLLTPGRQATSPAPPVPLAADDPVCVRDVTLQPDIRAIRFHLASTGGRPRPEILAEMFAKSDDRMLSHSALPGGPGTAGDVTIPLAGPRETLIGSICLKTAVPYTIYLTGTDDYRSRARSATAVGPQSFASVLSLTVLGPTTTTTSLVPTMLDRAARYVPIPAWLIGALGLLVLLALPLGVWWALQAAADEPASPDPTRP